MTGFSNDSSPDGRPLRLSRVATVAPNGPVEFVLTGSCGRVIGRLRFRTCQKCRTGRILDLWICEAWQRQGLGRELVCLLMAHCRGYRWNTTLQSHPGRAFFTAMTQETSVSLRHGSPLCPHLMGRLRRTWRRLFRVC
ncbi:GNAT family N-acetyltransferase [Streptomyces collinus]|uniref:GNAT family N-acetyltransferase n=1 Tax=Streptomyces collinus TaxID=42684 RepID=UPI0033C9E954